MFDYASIFIIYRYTAPDVLLRGMQTSLDMSVDLTTLVDGSTTIPEQVNPPDSPQVFIGI